MHKPVSRGPGGRPRLRSRLWASLPAPLPLLLLPLLPLLLLLQSSIHMRNNRVLQLVNEAAAKDPTRDSLAVLKKVKKVVLEWWHGGGGRGLAGSPQA